MDFFKQRQVLKQRKPEEEETQDKKDEKPSDSKCDSASVEKDQNNYNT